MMSSLPFPKHESDLSLASVSYKSHWVAVIIFLSEVVKCIINAIFTAFVCVSHLHKVAQVKINILQELKKKTGKR